MKPCTAQRPALSQRMRVTCPALLRPSGKVAGTVPSAQAGPTALGAATSWKPSDVPTYVCVAPVAGGALTPIAMVPWALMPRAFVRIVPLFKVVGGPPALGGLPPG